MKVQGKYKLHGIDSCNRAARSANNNTFYDTYEDALCAAEAYVSRLDRPCSGIVIFKAHKLVRPASAPVIIEDVD